MKQLQKIDRLVKASYFDTTTLGNLLGIEGGTLYANISRWLKQGILIQLKQGLYVTSEYWQSSRDRDYYREFIANQLRAPSYLSMEYVLQTHSIISEAVYGITSVTRKKTYTYLNQLATYSYTHLKKELFTGYELIDKAGFEIKQATRAKALFDYLYFRTQRVSQLGMEFLGSFRLNFEQITESDLVELEQYCELSNLKKYQNLASLIREMKNAN